jgi:Leucine-rich repeat (LRR) protein
MTRNFICLKENSDKFWTIKVEDKTITTYYGKNNKYGESKNSSNSFPTAEKCEKESQKLIDSKLKDGYEEVTLNFPDVPVYVLKYVQDSIESKATELSVDKCSQELLKEICRMTGLKKLKLENVKAIPEDIGRLAELEDLEINYSNDLKSIPKEIGRLTNLRRLQLGSTQITSLPDEIGNLTNLKNLRITGNTKLKSLPATVGKLVNLEKAYIEGNCENGELQIPKEIGDLKNLKELQIPSNNLKTIPKEIENLANLTELDLNFNMIRSLPVEISALENLETLSLQYNQIAELPVELCKLTSLAQIELDGCPVTNVPKEVIEEGVEAIFDHLKGGKTRIQKTSESVSPDVIARTLPKYKERLEEFHRKAKSKIYKDATKKTMEELTAFLSGASDNVPFGKTGDHYYFAHITDIFSPYKEWTFIDLRVLDYITQEAWSFKKNEDGFYENFYRWLKKEIETSDYEGFYQEVTKELKKKGIDEDLIFRQSLVEMKSCALNSNGTPSSFGTHLLSVMEPRIKDIFELSNKYYSVKENVVDLFLRYKEKEFEKYIPEMLVMDKYEGEDGTRHIPYDVLDKVCKINPEKYEKYAVDMIAQSDCKTCIAEAGRILKEYYKDRYDDRVFEIVKDTLEYVSEKKNKTTDSIYEFSWSRGERYSDNMPQYIEWILGNYGNKAQEMVFKYVKNTHVLSLNVIQVVVKYLGQDAVDVAGEALNMKIDGNRMAAHYRQLFTMLDGLDYSKYHDKVWEIAKSEFKEVRQTACLALSKMDGKIVIPKAGELLVSKKAHEREAGILILSLINSKESKEILKTLLDTEKNDDARDIIAESIYANEESITIDEVKERVKSATARGKLEKFPAKWIDEKTLPKLKWNDKKSVPIDVVRFLMYRQSRRKEIVLDFEAGAIYPLIDRKTSGDFAFKLLEMLLKNGGAKSQNRFALALVGILGDDRIVAPLEEIAINAMNENCCTTLGLHDSMESARALDRIMQAFRIKYPNVKNAAKEAFDRIAGKMGVTTFELSDRMMPDFGFGGLYKKFKIGKEEYTVKIDKNFKLVYMDAENKVLKSLPKAAAEKLKAEFKETGIKIKELAKQMKVNMENYLVMQRKWSKDDWEAFFFGNPLAFAFAQNFVWASYDKNKIKMSFIINEDLTASDVKDKTVKLTGTKIGLVHPMDLTGSERDEWKKCLSEKDVEPPFIQIERPVYTVADDEKGKSISFMFEETTLNCATFKSRAEKLGWRRGSVIDSGEVSSYRKSYEDKRIEVFIKTEGMGVQLDFDSEVTLCEFYFVKAGSIVTGSYTYDEPRNEDDDRLIKFVDVPGIIYSETINDLKKITKKKDDDD